MKICLTTLYDNNYKDIADITLPNIFKYCDKFKYEFVSYTKSLDETRHIYWSKLKAVFDCLAKYDVVLWCDIDSLFTRFTENYISKFYNPNLLAKINCLDRPPKDDSECQWIVSQMIFRQDDETFSFLERTYSKTEWIGHIWPEQMALATTAVADYAGRVEFAPIAKIIDPIDFLDGTVRYKIGSDDIVTVGGGPGAKMWKIEFLDLVSRMVKL